MPKCNKFAIYRVSCKNIGGLFPTQLDSLDTIIFHYFWKADAFLQNFLQSGHLFIYSFILLFIPFQTTQLLESGADINITDETVMTGENV